MSKRKLPPKYRKGKCPRCDIDIVANIPFIDGDLIGYKSHDHGCGPEVTLIVIRMTDEEIKEVLEV